MYGQYQSGYSSSDFQIKLSKKKEKKEAIFQHRPIIVVPMSYVNTKPSFEKIK